jgi:glycosyltransferase involved in cell wall biosynthesis
VGNHPQGLARGERQAGLESTCVAFQDMGFAYEVDELLATRNPLEFERRRWALLRRALREVDVVHFNFGRSLFPPPPPTTGLEDLVHVPGRLYARLLALRDLPLLHRRRKTITVTFQGDDARQAHGPDVPPSRRRLADDVGEDYYTVAGDALKRRTIATFDRYADRIFFLNPDLGDFLPSRATFVPYASVDPAEWQPREPAPLPARPTIVHAPSHRGVKGTERVVEAVSQLQGEGMPLEFRLIEGLTQAEARGAYEQADLLVDQLLVGWYGGLAVELMALGKPVVCFVDEETARRHAPQELVDDLPVVRASPADLADVLRGLLTERRTDYPGLAQRARAFVERWHDPVTIGAQMRTEYEAAQAEGQARSRESRA